MNVMWRSRFNHAFFTFLTSERGLIVMIVFREKNEIKGRSITIPLRLTKLKKETIMIYCKTKENVKQKLPLFATANNFCNIPTLSLFCPITKRLLPQFFSSDLFYTWISPFFLKQYVTHYDFSIVFDILLSTCAKNTFQSHFKIFTIHFIHTLMSNDSSCHAVYFS